ncbi:MAG: hypothetical protein LBF58_04740 [Deltaproteobacteria bacterium]|jgi:hypothetical protein|nr:hypothetical protein [Deltaproteobacteria bacterium]
MNSNPTNSPPKATVGTAGQAGADIDSGKGPLEVVTVMVFDRPCRFKSNRPDVVYQIASLAEEETALVRDQFPGLKNEMDLAAHVAFRLARRLAKCLKDIGELNSSLDEAEERVDRMAMDIDQRLGE